MNTGSRRWPRPLAWNGTRRIVSYIYRDRATKAPPARNGDVAGGPAVVREIHLSADGWRESLKHELVHVVSGSFAPYLVKPRSCAPTG